MLALISPAKKQAFTPGPDAVAPGVPLFPRETGELAAILGGFDVDGLMRLMKISRDLATLNVGRFRDFSATPAPESTRPALTAFQGDTYVGLDAGGFSAGDWAFACDHLAILSGLYGLLRPNDPILPHRLEMGTPLGNPRGKNLHAFWGDRISDAIAERLRGHADPRVINLASAEYFKAVRPGRLPGGVLTPVFKEPHAGGYRVVGIQAKRARGAMARFLIQNRLTAPEPLKGFTDGGYRFRADLSDDGQWVFVSS